jgi:NAD-dependent histone deacetylase SIR2
MLEVKAGLHTDIDPNAECIPLHGSLGHLRCQVCRTAFDWEDHLALIHSEDDLPCPQCRLSRQERINKCLRPTSIGHLVPDIALLGADHSNGEAIAEVIESDLRASPDMLLVLGTSLRVSGPKKLACTFARVVQRANGTVVYMNLSMPSSLWARMVDYVLEGACDTWVKDLETRLMKRVLVRSRIEEACENRVRGRRHRGRGRKKRMRTEKVGGESKQDGSAEYHLL